MIHNVNNISTVSFNYDPKLNCINNESLLNIISIDQSLFTHRIQIKQRRHLSEEAMVA